MVYILKRDIVESLIKELNTNTRGYNDFIDNINRVYDSLDKLVGYTHETVSLTLLDEFDTSDREDVKYHINNLRFDLDVILKLRSELSDAINNVNETSDFCCVGPTVYDIEMGGDIGEWWLDEIEVIDDEQLSDDQLDELYDTHIVGDTHDEVYWSVINKLIDNCDTSNKDEGSYQAVHNVTDTIKNSELSQTDHIVSDLLKVFYEDGRFSIYFKDEFKDVYDDKVEQLVNYIEDLESLYTQLKLDEVTSF